MGRPRLGEEKERPHSLTIRISADLKARLQAEAERRNASMGDVMHDAIELYWRAAR